MRVKLDENLSLRLKPALIELGHDADTVRDELLQGRPDAQVWAAMASLTCAAPYLYFGDNSRGVFGRLRNWFYPE
jgi:hypothetical protein